MSDNIEEYKPVKQAFGSPGGKSCLAPKIVEMIPEHKTYVEPFAGGAAVYFKKPPSEKEVLNDKDVEIAFAYRFMRDLTSEQFEKLRRKPWVINERQFKKVKNSNPTSDLERFYKFYYLNKASYSNGRGSCSIAESGNKIGVDHLWTNHERLLGTAVNNTNAENLIETYDSPDTFIYLDPPYPNRAFVNQNFKDGRQGNDKP
jgi:DNA adenine methylase